METAGLLVVEKTQGKLFWFSIVHSFPPLSFELSLHAPQHPQEFSFDAESHQFDAISFFPEQVEYWCLSACVLALYSCIII
jgi:hypothetical protein